MASNTSNVLFDDIFTINAIDKEGKKFDRGVPHCSHTLQSSTFIDYLPTLYV